jgi:uncharacterized protein (TIGR02453 family)
MSHEPVFQGFSKKTIDFFKGLARHNDRVWFEAHRDDYEAYVMAPSRAFVTDMGARLREIVPKINAIPKVNKSIFRIARDTRFSLDASPYKTNLGLYFWEGTGGRMEGAGFYMHLEPPEFFIGGGLYMFGDRQLPRFRKAATDKASGTELTAIVAAVRAVPGFSVEGKHYKRTPAGYDPNHPNAGLLLHNGLYGGWGETIPDEFYSAALVDLCFEKYKILLPLHRWLVKYVA